MGVMGGVAGIVEACSEGSATSVTGLMGDCVARSSKRVPHLRGLTVVVVDMAGENGASRADNRVCFLIVRRR